MRNLPSRQNPLQHSWDKLTALTVKLPPVNRVFGPEEPPSSLGLTFKEGNVKPFSFLNVKAKTYGVSQADVITFFLFTPTQ